MIIRHCHVCGKDVECYVSVDTEIVGTVVKVLAELWCNNCAAVLATGETTIELNEEWRKSCE